MFFSKKKPAKRASASSARSAKSKKNTKKGLISRLNLSRRESQFILFVMVFSLLGGGYYAYRSYAATPLCRERILKAGSSDKTCVTYLQQVLKSNGYDPGAADGIYGPKTTAAVKAFQSSPQRGGYGTKDQLVADGIAGPKTGLHLCAFFGSHPYCSSRPSTSGGSSGGVSNSVSGSTAIKTVTSTNNKGGPSTGGTSGGSSKTQTPSEKCSNFLRTIPSSRRIASCVVASSTSSKQHTVRGSSPRICVKYFGPSGNIEADFEFRSPRWGVRGSSDKDNIIGVDQSSCAKGSGTSVRNIDIYIHRLSRGETYMVYYN